MSEEVAFRFHVNCRFKSEYNLNRHLKKHSQKDSQPQQTYKCSHCDSVFTKKQQLRKHEYVVCASILSSE